jgi:hypothetical protein
MKITLFLLVLLSSPQVLAQEQTVKVVATVLGNPITNVDKKVSAGRIIRELLQDYAAQNDLKPTKRDIKQYNQYKKLLRELTLQLNKKDEKRLISLKELRKLSDSETNRLNMATRIITINNDYLNDPKAVKFRENIIQQWKVNKALFEKYGGGVTFQQIGMEPAEAWLAFFRDEIKNGNLVFHESEFEEYFWLKVTPNKKHWSFSDKTNSHFESPIWITGLKTIRNELKELELNNKH